MPPLGTSPLTPTIYLPIEEAEREISSKLLVAACAAARGLTAIVGQVWLLNDNLAHLPRGAILFKGNNSIQLENMRLARRHGHRVASIEEEALGVARADQILRLYANGVEDACELILVQGRFQRDVIAESHPTARDRIEIVGNPRMDFLKSDFLVAERSASEAIRKEFGDFVLINTNFSGANSKHGDALATFEAAVEVEFFRANSVGDERLYDELLNWEHACVHAIARLVSWFESRSDGPNIIIRPHPSERIETWLHGLAKSRRSRVIHVGGHLPWTLASRILIHAGCTTGMEAFFAHHPAIALVPGDSAWHSCFLSNQVNPTFTDVAEAGRYALATLSGDSSLDSLRPGFVEVLEQHLAALNKELSADSVVDAIVRKLMGSAVLPSMGWSPSPAFQRERTLSPAQQAKMVKGVENIDERLKQIKSAVPALARVRISEIGQYMYCLDAA